MMMIHDAAVYTYHARVLSGAESMFLWFLVAKREESKAIGAKSRGQCVSLQFLVCVLFVRCALDIRPSGQLHQSAAFFDEYPP
jgi:hypothetical protein